MQSDTAAALAAIETLRRDSETGAVVLTAEQALVVAEWGHSEPFSNHPGTRLVDALKATGETPGGSLARWVMLNAPALPLLCAVARAAAGLVAYQTDDTGSPWWAWGHCLGCGAEAGPPNNTGYSHAPNCPALALDAALAALAAHGGGAGMGGEG